uniref:Transcription initiation factor TFIID subunit 3-like n=1 Tax=Saccoglossus kowalevskii TaxID=10224 RepID=A0ABM0M4G9_SACKO|nr:PREDICTED: transcription initiation factor TFIID subunit 3-like [Saccoglossus kowalevskii]
MSNASDSDASKIADNCGNAFGFGKLFRKSFGKKGKKIDDNRREKERDKEKIKDKEKDTVDNKETKDKKIDLLTFSAQFPPEDWPQVLQEMKRKAAVIKRDKNGGKYETSLVNHNGGSPKASPKKDHVVICDEVEHIPGPSTSKDRKIKVYRKKDDSDPLPESEAEFIIPTKMYDDKCRTKAVSEQLRKQYSRKHKEDPWKYLREKEGKAMKKNTEKEAAVNGVNGTRPKRTSAKERPKSDPRDIRLRSIAQIRTAEYVSKLPTSADVNDVQHWDDDIHLDVDSSEFTTSDNNRVLSHRAKSNLRSPKKATADHDFESSDMTPSEDLRGRHTSRHYRAIKRDATKIIRDIQSRVDDTSDTFTSDQEDYATHHHHHGCQVISTKSSNGKSSAKRLNSF